MFQILKKNLERSKAMHENAFNICKSWLRNNSFGNIHRLCGLLMPNHVQQIEPIVSRFDGKLNFFPKERKTKCSWSFEKQSNWIFESAWRDHRERCHFVAWLAITTSSFQLIFQFNCCKTSREGKLQKTLNKSNQVGLATMRFTVKEWATTEFVLFGLDNAITF